MNYNCSILRDLINLQEQVKKAFCYQKLFWAFTVWINCSSDLKKISNSWPSASNFKSFSRSLKQFVLTVGQNNFSNKMLLNLTLLYFKNWFQPIVIFMHFRYMMEGLWRVFWHPPSYHSALPGAVCNLVWPQLWFWTQLNRFYP